MRKPGFLLLLVTLTLCCWPSSAAEAPQWMRALTARSVPPQDNETDAVLLYSERNVNVVSADKIKTTVREAYKILRPGGRDYGDVVVIVGSNEKITSIRGWCIPAQGKDYEVKEKDSAEVALPKVEGSELISDVRAKVMHIPAPDPGNIVGYEYEIEQRPMLLQDVWVVQRTIPVLESRYSLQLPVGWEHKPVWLNLPETKPSQGSNNTWTWALTDQKSIRIEEDMPPFSGVSGRVFVTFMAPGDATGKGIANWQQLGTWYHKLAADQIDSSPEIKQKVAELAGSATDAVAKMKAIARFVQHDIRYVAIELGIGGWQPHPAHSVFANRYGDCKDKATLMASMLREVGVESYYVVINTQRGSIGPDSPAHNGFNHVILAVKLPSDATAASVTATMQHPQLGRVVFFDPTDMLTPFGEVGGSLQANYGMLVTPQGGELVKVPQQPSSMNGTTRKGKFVLNADGNLTGDVEDYRRGDRAWIQRWNQRNVTTETARIKPVEVLLGRSLPNFRITKANMMNLQKMDQPFGFTYTFEAAGYAKKAGGLLLVRPRVVGTKASAILETDKARQFAIEFEAPVKDEDQFEIVLPAGYEVDELPMPVDVEFSFASYHSRTEAKGNSIIYTRTFEVKELSVPVSRAAELKKFYRIITGDERATAVLKPR